MASLARSLLALAVLALLNTATADLFPLGHNRRSNHHSFPSDRQKSCKTVFIGKRANDPRFIYDLDPIQIYKADSVVKIEDPNREPPRVGTDLIGEEITVCNRKRGGAPFHVGLVRQKIFDYVSVRLGFCDPSPAHMEMYVTRHLQVAGGGPPDNRVDDNQQDD